MGKILVGKASEIKPGSMKGVVADGKNIVIANVDGKFYAMRGLCNHQDGPLAEGELEGNIITCPWHGSKWDVTTGKMTEFPIDLDDEPTYAVTMEGEDLYVDA